MAEDYLGGFARVNAQRLRTRVTRKVVCAVHEGFSRPRMVMSRAVSYLILRMVSAILV